MLVGGVMRAKEPGSNYSCLEGYIAFEDGALLLWSGFTRAQSGSRVESPRPHGRAQQSGTGVFEDGCPKVLRESYGLKNPRVPAVARDSCARISAEDRIRLHWERCVVLVGRCCVLSAFRVAGLVLCHGTTA